MLSYFPSVLIGGFCNTLQYLIVYYRIFSQKFFKKPTILVLRPRTVINIGTYVYINYTHCFPWRMSKLLINNTPGCMFVFWRSPTVVPYHQVIDKYEPSWFFYRLQLCSNFLDSSDVCLRKIKLFIWIFTPKVNIDWPLHRICSFKGFTLILFGFNLPVCNMGVVLYFGSIFAIFCLYISFTLVSFGFNLRGCNMAVVLLYFGSIFLIFCLYISFTLVSFSFNLWESIFVIFCLYMIETKKD